MSEVICRRGRKGTLFVNNTLYRADKGVFDLGHCAVCETNSIKDKMIVAKRTSHISEQSH
jgi:hypothetical protein